MSILSPCHHFQHCSNNDENSNKNTKDNKYNSSDNNVDDNDNTHGLCFELEQQYGGKILAEKIGYY